MQRPLVLSYYLKFVASHERQDRSFPQVLQEYWQGEHSYLAES